MAKCKCDNKNNWFVRQYKACWHHIGQNVTYRLAKSSLVECKACGRNWRTDAKYVDGLERKYPTPYITSLRGDIVFKAQS